LKSNYISGIWMLFLFCLLSGFLIWGVFYVEDLKSKISILGIVAVIVAAFTSVLSVGINNSKAKEREYELHILKEKQKVFEHFYNSYFEMIKGIKKVDDGLTDIAEKEMLEFKKGLMNWGSDSLIKHYLDFENKLINQETFNILKDGNNFIKALRKELGFRDSADINVMSIILNAQARKELKDKEVI